MASCEVGLVQGSGTLVEGIMLSQGKDQGSRVLVLNSFLVRGFGEFESAKTLGPEAQCMRILQNLEHAPCKSS